MAEPESSGVPTGKEREHSTDQVLQLTFGVINSGSSRLHSFGGWQIKDVSPTLEANRALQDRLSEGTRTSITPVTELHRFPTPEEIAARPRTFLYQPNEEGMLLSNCIAAGTDGTGRDGNVFSHVALVQPGEAAHSRPIDWWKASWQQPYGTTEVAASSVQENSLHADPETMQREVQSFLNTLSHDTYRMTRFLSYMDALAWAGDADGRTVVLALDDKDVGHDNSAVWIAAATHLMSKSESRKISFSTHERLKDVSKYKSPNRFGVREKENEIKTVIIPQRDIQDPNIVEAALRQVPPGNILILQDSQDFTPEDDTAANWNDIRGTSFPQTAWSNEVARTIVEGPEAIAAYLQKRDSLDTPVIHPVPETNPSPLPAEDTRTALEEVRAGLADQGRGDETTSATEHERDGVEIVTASFKGDEANPPIEVTNEHGTFVIHHVQYTDEQGYVQNGAINEIPFQDIDQVIETTAQANNGYLREAVLRVLPDGSVAEIGVEGAKVFQITADGRLIRKIDNSYDSIRPTQTPDFYYDELRLTGDDRVIIVAGDDNNNIHEQALQSALEELRGMNTQDALARLTTLITEKDHASVSIVDIKGPEPTPDPSRYPLYSEALGTHYRMRPGKNGWATRYFYPTELSPEQGKIFEDSFHFRASLRHTEGGLIRLEKHALRAQWSEKDLDEIRQLYDEEITRAQATEKGQHAPKDFPLYYPLLDIYYSVDITAEGPRFKFPDRLSDDDGDLINRDSQTPNPKPELVRFAGGLLKLEDKRAYGTYPTPEDDRQMKQHLEELYEAEVASVQASTLSTSSRQASTPPASEAPTVSPDAEVQTDPEQDPPELAQLLQAADLVLNTQYAGVFMIKRKLKISLERAHEILAELAAAGIVGPAEGTQARDVLVSPGHDVATVATFETRRDEAITRLRERAARETPDIPASRTPTSDATSEPQPHTPPSEELAAAADEREGALEQLTIPGGVSEDDLYDAYNLIISTQSGSASMIQRRLRTGYTQAQAIMHLFERAGIVGAQEGSKARDVLVSTDDQQAVLAALKKRLGMQTERQEEGVDADAETTPPPTPATPEAEAPPTTRTVKYILRDPAERTAPPTVGATDDTEFDNTLDRGTPVPQTDETEREKKRRKVTVTNASVSGRRAVQPIRRDEAGISIISTAGDSKLTNHVLHDAPTTSVEAFLSVSNDLVQSRATDASTMRETLLRITPDGNHAEIGNVGGRVFKLQPDGGIGLLTDDVAMLEAGSPINPRDHILTVELIGKDRFFIVTGDATDDIKAVDIRHALGGAKKLKDVQKALARLIPTNVNDTNITVVDIEPRKAPWKAISAGVAAVLAATGFVTTISKISGEPQADNTRGSISLSQSETNTTSSSSTRSQTSRTTPARQTTTAGPTSIPVIPQATTTTAPETTTSSSPAEPTSESISTTTTTESTAPVVTTLTSETTTTSAPAEATTANPSPSTELESTAPVTPSPSTSTESWDATPITPESTLPATEPEQNPEPGTTKETLTIEALLQKAKTDGTLVETTLKAQGANNDWKAVEKALEKLNMDTTKAHLNIATHIEKGIGLLADQNIDHLKGNTTYYVLSEADRQLLGAMGGELTPSQMAALKKQFPDNSAVKTLDEIFKLNHAKKHMPASEIQERDKKAATTYLWFTGAVSDDLEQQLAQAIIKKDATALNALMPQIATALDAAPQLTLEKTTPANEQTDNETPTSPDSPPLLTIEGDMPETVVETVTVDTDVPDMWHEAQELLETHSDLSDAFIESEAATPLVNSVMAFMEGANNTDDIPQNRQLKVPTKDVVRLFATTANYASGPADQTPRYMQAFVRDYNSFGVSVSPNTHQENPNDKTRPFIEDFAARSNVHLNAYEAIMNANPDQDIETTKTQLNVITDAINYIQSLPEAEKKQYEALFDKSGLRKDAVQKVIEGIHNPTTEATIQIQDAYKQYAALSSTSARSEITASIFAAFWAGLKASFNT